MSIVGSVESDGYYKEVLSWQAEGRLRGVHPLPPRQAKEQVRKVQSGPRGCAQFKANQARAVRNRDSRLAFSFEFQPRVSATQ